ncbi:hypothetical protein [Sporosarcina sp. USHLN248]|uniref:hypothetical protein n=1 Tax=Sporosarcina sp. USHLN248 TaxID=3081300 RepID=UPI003018BA1E
MKKYYTLLFISLFALVLVGCSDHIKTVDTKEAEAIDVSDYFPPIGMMRTYNQYDPDGKTVEAIDTVNLSINSDGPDTVYIHEKGGMASESIKEYAVNEKEVRLVYVVNALKNEETAIVELSNKPKWEKNDSDKSISYLTATGLTVEVPAGKYDNVIEVTTVIPNDKKGRKTVHYYAPEIGLIKTVFGFEDGDNFTFSELKSLEMKEDTSEADHQVKQDEETTTDATEDEETTSADAKEGVYSNKQYGFSFEMPADMLKRLTADTGSWDSDAIATVDFTFTDTDRSIEQSLFSIIVFENDGNADNWEHTVYKYVGSNDSYIFAYTMSSEPNEEMLKPENEDLLKKVQQIAEVSRQSMETFEAE